MNHPLRTPMALRRLAEAALGVALLSWAGPASAAELNVVRGLELQRAGADTTVSIDGTQAPVYTVFRLENPARVVVDLASADLSAVQGTTPGQGAVKQVSASQFSDGKSSVGRVVIALADGARYDVKSAGDHVKIEVTSGDAAAPAVKVEAKVDAPAPAADPHLVSQRTDEKHLAHAASRITGARVVKKGKVTRLEVSTNAPVGTYEVIELRDPSRLAIDLTGVASAARLNIKALGPVKDLRAGKQADGMRLVLDTEPLAAGSYKIERTSKGLAVSFSAAEVAQAEPVAAPVEKGASLTVAPTQNVKVSTLAFKGDEQKAHVAIALSRSTTYEVTHPDAHTAVLTLHHAELPPALERSLDTSAFGGPVKMVSSFASPGTQGDVQVVATLDGEAKDQVQVGAKGLSWVFKTSGEPEMTIDGHAVDLAGSTLTRAAGLQTEAPAYAFSSAARRPKYTGRRVSFEFENIDIHNLLRIIAEVSKKNIVVSDDVTGKVTIRLRNVPWDQALDVILKTKGLDKDSQGNIIRIMHADQLLAERKAAAEAHEARQAQEEPKLRLIPINYADASEISDRVKDLLSKRGTVTVDKRTNVLIVKDIAESLARVEGLVRNLDLQTPQVLIEARIVEANSTFTHELGVQWGGQIGFSPTLGNATGLVFPSTAVVTGGGSANQAFPGLNGTPNFAVDLPAAVGTGQGGGLGMIFGSAGGAATLNLRISALESSGQAKTISAPKVTTIDNHAATISQGIAIPFSQFSAAGVNTTFIEAKLELKVLPHVTSDGSVVLNIDATNNQPNPGFSGSNGQPSITKKEAHTQVLVKDGDTTVIGGIYTRTSAQNQTGLPILSHIPVLGYFFRHQLDTDTRTELLIFVTPHIVNRQQAIAAAATSAPAAPAPAANP